jgi:TetR/AcrR family transcriptional repressor of nem operon
MTSRGEATREKILQATQELILENGFSATSIDKVLENSGLTKGAFFYHFKNKEALTRAVIERYSRREQLQLDSVFERARGMTRDPLQQLLVGVSLLIEGMETEIRAAGRMNPGCLYGSYAYELPVVDDDAMQTMRDTVVHWRKTIRDQLERVSEQYAPRSEVDLDALADNLLAVVEGGLILGRLMDDAGQLLEHLKLYRNHLELLFTPAQPRDQS